MFRLPDSWVWDFWFAHDGERHHLFFLYASRALHDPDARHYRASIGHAVSDDLVTWTRVADALVRSDAPAWDDLATWTGSVVRGEDGLWYLFYTGSTLTKDGNVQRVGYATSPDLMTWHKASGNPVVAADPRWYEVLADGQWHDEAFRDPWVLRADDWWHMLITARANRGPADDRGVIGHATSPDLRTWTPQPPLSEPGAGFGQLEVVQVEQVHGQWIAVFSCLRADLSAAHAARRGATGVWAARAAGPLGPYDLASAYPITDASLYSGRLVRHEGRWFLLAFHHDAADGSFVGAISDPMPVRVVEGRLVVDRDEMAA